MEFLFDNPILIFLLIGLISSFLKKAKGEDEQKQKPKRPARPEKRVPHSPSENKRPREAANPRGTKSHNENPFKGLELEPISKNEPKHPLNDIQKKYEDRRQERDQMVMKEVKTKSPVKYEEKNVGGLSLKPNPDRLIEGIAWAQILGEPRSKNPHRTMKRK
jgi:hypothetical protein